MKAIFMGTPDFAVPILESMIEAGCEVLLAVTQPDRPKGRHGELTPSPVKESAIAHGIDVFQPESLKDGSGVDRLQSLEPDFIVVAAYGQILPKAVLDIPKHCCVNIHASLLPEYRGASPIQHSILDGRKVTGVTAMRMDEGLDTGDIIMTLEVPISDDDTAGTLFDKLAAAGGKLIPRVLEAIEDGSAKYTPQDDSKVSYTGMIRKSDGLIDFERSAVELSFFVRGMNPWPGAYTYLKDKTLKLWEVSAVEGISLAPGQIEVTPEGELYIGCGQGALRVESLQLAGKKRMDTASFLRGMRLNTGDKLGM